MNTELEELKKSLFEIFGFRDKTLVLITDKIFAAGQASGRNAAVDYIESHLTGHGGIGWETLKNLLQVARTSN